FDLAGPAWTPEYPVEFRQLLPELAGYQHYDSADVPGSPGGYYIVGSRQRYDVHDPARTARGLVLTALDSLGAATRVQYDDHDLLPVRTTDAAALTVEAENDLRMLRPRRMTD